MASSTQQTAALVIDKEVDARFWINTGYKPGKKLDLTVPTDRAMAKAWEDDRHQAAAAAADATKQKHIADAQNATQTPPPSTASVHAAAQEAAASPPPAGTGGHHHVGHHQSQTAPATVAAAGRPKRDQPIPPDIHPSDLATARRNAPALATASSANYVGISCPPGSSGAAITFGSHDDLVTWYNAQVINPVLRGCYVAAFDKLDPAWPGPIADGMGGEAAIIVSASPPEIEVGPVTVTQSPASPAVDPWANTAENAPASPAPTAAPGPRESTADASLPTLAAPKLSNISTGNGLLIAAALLGAAGLAYVVLREPKRDTVPPMPTTPRSMPPKRPRETAVSRELARARGRR